MRVAGRLPGGSSAWGGRSTSSRPQFSARLLRLGSIADSFQHAPEARGSAAGGRHHVAGAQEVRSECPIC